MSKATSRHGCPDDVLSPRGSGLHMKLKYPFIQLPMRVDADRLLAEVEALGEAAWRPHPQGFPGNWGLPLLAVDGDPENDLTAGPMRPTRNLEQCPYLIHVLSTLGAVWGRSRLMRLDGNAEVTPHVDTNVYWRERTRVHIPIQTQPAVRFECGEAAVHMAAGECWIFDTWRLHRVENPATARRIHLVADTVGSEQFWEFVANGRRHDQRIPGWAPRAISVAAGKLSDLLTEAVNRSQVVSPWELKDALNFVLGEAAPHPQLAQVHAIAARLMTQWRALWARYGEHPSGKPAYRVALEQFSGALAPLAGQLALHNGLDLTGVMSSLVVMPALRDESHAARKASAEAGELPKVRDVGPVNTQPIPGLRGDGGDAVFEKPIFVICAPRSGSTLLFETLCDAPGLYTLGGENYAVLEGVSALHPRNRNFDSNRLCAADATEAVTAELRHRYFSELRDRYGEPPRGAPVRMMDKTPKNALRVAFLARVFPDARFVVLHRNPQQVLSSMIEAWESGKFRTYPGLPDWPGTPWSLLLVPGWRELRGRALHEIVATQWARTIDTMVDDLETLPKERWSVLRYDTLVDDPQAALCALCESHQLRWDRVLGADLPLSRNTVTPPDREKWRRHQQEIGSAWSLLEGAAHRIEQFVASA